MASGNGFFSNIKRAFSSGDFVNRARRTFLRRQDAAPINVREASRRGPQFSRQVPQQPQESEPTQDTTGVVYTSQTTPETVRSVEAGLKAGVGKERQAPPPQEYSQRIVKGSQVAQAQEAGVPFGEVPEPEEVETENADWVTEGGGVVAPKEPESPSVLSDGSASPAPSAGPISRPIIVYSDSGASSRPGASEIRGARSTREKRQALMISLLAREPSQEEKGLSEVVGGLKSIFWPFGRRSQEQASQVEQDASFVQLPKPGTPQYNLAVQTRNILSGLDGSVERFPELAGETELLQRLSSAAPDLARSIIETTGQIRGVEFIPPERTDEQRFSFNPQQDRLFSLELPVDRARNFIRIAEQPLNKAVGSILPRGVGKFVGSGVQNVTSKLAIASKGVTSAALKLGAKVGLKAALALTGPAGWIALVPDAFNFLNNFLKRIIPGTFGIIAVGILFITSMGAGSFSVARGGSSIEPGGSEYIAIKTEVDPKASFENSELPTTVVYKIKIIPKQVVLGAVDVKVSIAVSNKDGSKTIEDKTFKAREVDSEFVLDVPVEVKPEYADSTLVASIRATARVHEQPERQSETASSVARIGNPPEDCPNGWATPFGRINSKPNDPDVWTHKNAEAIDIGNSNGVRIEGAPILSTHKGKVSYNCGDNAYGNCIKVTTTCNGRSVSTLYAHMRVRTVENDKDITAGVKLGEVGATGNVWGTDPNHLHYEFQKIGGQVTIPMQPPYVPRTPDVGVTW